jgi:Arc/MetJ-type ribon-helix-helix transcriptional regulator
MNLSRLPADLEEVVERELAAGEYRSEAEPVADAVRLLRECHKSHEGPLKNGTMHVPIWEVFQWHPAKARMRRLSTLLARVDGGYLTPTMIISSA